MCDFFQKTSQSGLLIYLIVPRTVKLLNVPLLGDYKVGNVRKKRLQERLINNLHKETVFLTEFGKFRRIRKHGFVC